MNKESDELILVSEGFDFDPDSLIEKPKRTKRQKKEKTIEKQTDNLLQNDSIDNYEEFPNAIVFSIGGNITVITGDFTFFQCSQKSIKVEIKNHINDLTNYNKFYIIAKSFYEGLESDNFLSFQNIKINDRFLFGTEMHNAEIIGLSMKVSELTDTQWVEFDIKLP